MLNDISSFSVENLTSEESPKDLDHDVWVLGGFIDQNFLKGEQKFLGFFVFSLFIQDFSIVLQLLAVTNSDTLLLLEALKGESVLFSKFLEVWSVKDI